MTVGIAADAHFSNSRFTQQTTGKNRGCILERSSRIESISANQQHLFYAPFDHGPIEETPQLLLRGHLSRYDMRHRIQADLPEDSNLEQLLFDGLGRHLRDKNGR